MEISKRTHCNSRRVSDANVFDEKQEYVVYRFNLKPAKMKEDGKTSENIIQHCDTFILACKLDTILHLAKKVKHHLFHDK